MKNIHVLPTNKLSRLYYSGNNSELLLSKHLVSFRTFDISTQHIYITNDEEIKEGDYIFETDNNTVNIADKYYCRNEFDFKIILTDNQDLIKDAVQAIDDEFLEWFVNNSNCEEIGVKKYKNGKYWTYEINIPQEKVLLQSSIDGEVIWGETKQKLENILSKQPSKFYDESELRLMVKEYSERHQDVSGNLGKYLVQAVFRDGYQTAQKRMYSDEEVLKAQQAILANIKDALQDENYIINYLKQFKKK